MKMSAVRAMVSVPPETGCPGPEADDVPALEPHALTVTTARTAVTSANSVPRLVRLKGMISTSGRVTMRDDSARYNGQGFDLGPRLGGRQRAVEYALGVGGLLDRG